MFFKLISGETFFDNIFPFFLFYFIVWFHLSGFLSSFYFSESSSFYNFTTFVFIHMILLHFRNFVRNISFSSSFPTFLYFLTHKKDRKKFPRSHYEVLWESNVLDYSILSFRFFFPLNTQREDGFHTTNDRYFQVL